MQTHQAIVLHTSWPHGWKIVLLDRQLGRIAVSVPKESYKLVVSAFISYEFIAKSSGIDRLNRVTIDHVPLVLARKELAFIQGLIELIYYSSVAGEAYPELYDLMRYLLELELLTELIKVIALIDVLRILDLYDRALPLPSFIFDYLIYLQSDTMLKEYVDESKIKDLRLWIERCILIHPYKDKLKILLNLERGVL